MQVKPAPLVMAVTVTPVGIVSTTVVGLALATGPELLACTVKVKLAPEAALAMLAIFEIVKFGWLASGTVVVPVQRAGSGATQPGSPVVVVAVLVTLLVPVLVTVKVTTVALTAPAATPVVDTQLT